jgi:hypothetical protein
MAVQPGDIGGFVALIFGGTSVLMLARAWSRKIEHQTRQPRVPAETAERMERMERAIDAVAVEIERISESQRFLTKLLAERGESAGALPRPGASWERVP